MSRGELIVDDNQIKASDDWAGEYQQQYNANPDAWADQFVREEASFIIINIYNTIYCYYSSCYCSCCYHCYLTCVKIQKLKRLNDQCKQCNHIFCHSPKLDFRECL